MIQNQTFIGNNDQYTLTAIISCNETDPRTLSQSETWRLDA